MRSRTELVTTQLEGSDFEDEPSDLEDSEEDWKPEPSKTKRKRNALCVSLRKNNNRKSKTIKKSNNNNNNNNNINDNKKNNNDIDDNKKNNNNIDDNKKNNNNKKAKKEYSSSSEDQDSDDTIESDKNSKSSLSSLEELNETFLLPKPLNRKINNIKSFPDRHGVWELLIDKNDLKCDLMKNKDVCLWRRDGSSLLQKYIRDKNDEKDSNILAFVSSSVYSCWEDRRKNDFLEIKVQCFGDKKGGRVKIIDDNILNRINKASKRKNGEDNNENEEDEEEAEDDEDEDEEIEEEEDHDDVTNENDSNSNDDDDDDDDNE